MPSVRVQRLGLVVSMTCFLFNNYTSKSYHNIGQLVAEVLCANLILSESVLFLLLDRLRFP